MQDHLNLGMYDYGARFYDRVIGRWNGMDPLANMRMSLTPYNFPSNNPIFGIRPTGVLDNPIYEKDGAYLGDDGRTGGDLAFIGERDGKGREQYDVPASVFTNEANWSSGNFSHNTGNKRNSGIKAMGTYGHSIFWKTQ